MLNRMTASERRCCIFSLAWKNNFTPPPPGVPSKSNGAEFPITPITLFHGKRARPILSLSAASKNPKDLYYSLDPGVTILRAGRPVLFVPDEIELLQARRVIVAWKDTRECRRAVRDALPFLKEASEIMVLTVCEPGTGTQAKPSLDDVETYLVRHGVAVGAKAFLHTKQSTATQLLRFADDERADLIVAGGYGHSRLGEWALGGVTRELLSESPLCCLFSH